ncbi:3-deoxy-D-manno-octulosonic-acid transferase [Ereboglobus sp. PH5-10]|nr:3-deoxy-D-manno-octulosonic-acid transferase [Ereboglobus sp. PH5-10]
MIWVYRILFFPALFFMLPYYLLRMWRRGGYKSGFSQRFGAVNLPPKNPAKKRVWLQAVSVGEMQAISPLLQALKARGDVEVYLTTTTSTGHKIALDRYGEKSGITIGTGYFPLDWWAFSARAWRRVRPDLVILMEGERWPEHIAQARRRGVPVLAVNARLSDRSYSRMKAWRAVAMPLMQRGITRVLACSEIDAERFRELGFTAEQVTVTGNIKWDVTIPLMSAEERVSLRAEIGLGANANELILLGSSTWPGEEDALLEALRAIRAAGIAARLLLVPRHMERRGEVEALLQKQTTPDREDTAPTWHFRSRGAAPGVVDIAVGDTTGELRKFTQLADLVFVGKSLPPHTEGQTPVEAAALGRAILFGPGMGNFREIARRLTDAGAAKVVHNRKELCVTAARILGDADARAKMMTASTECYRGNQGAVARTLEIIEKTLG